MRIEAIRPVLLAMAFALAGCGGGGGGGVASLPPPPPPPPPPPTAAAFVVVPAATTTQQFTVAGASHLTDGDAPHLDTADQLQIRYDASSKTYEVQLPGSETWTALSGTSESEAKGGGVTVLRQYSGDQSTIVEWFTDGLPRGIEAIGAATPVGSIPVVGSATYSAWAFARTPESGPGLIDNVLLGDMTFNFDFAHGTLAGSAIFDLDPEWHDYTLGPFAFRDTVYSTGSTSFSGRFDTDVAGLNSFSGVFTGPTAQELIGNFALPYRSPIDSQTYQAAGAFVGKKD